MIEKNACAQNKAPLTDSKYNMCVNVHVWMCVCIYSYCNEG